MHRVLTLPTTGELARSTLGGAPLALAPFFSLRRASKPAAGRSISFLSLFFLSFSSSLFTHLLFLSPLSPKNHLNLLSDLTARDAALRYYGRQLASALALGAGVLAASRSLSSSSSSSSSFVTPELVARAKALLLPAALSKQLDAAAGRTLRLELGLLPALSAAALALALAVALKLRSKTKACYLLDFACYKPPEECKVPLEVFLQQSRDAGVFDADALDFQTRVSERNGVSDHAYFPPALHASADERRARLGDGVSATSRTMREAREEAQMVLFGTVSELLARLGLQPSDIDILVVNCSLFNPTPSLSAMIINHFKMRSDVTSFNLAGMGCSAGVLAVQLAQKLLQTQRGRNGGKGAYALVVSTENVTQNWYAFFYFFIFLSEFGFQRKE